ncbi:hypothetical protein M501DRAFT_1014608 [Patellaria atrata CBS 101060]|uniref:Uncharacterized protein n=1 Tax=Patellaria atrata CBS 101060 TaxID=1346257 RepID=A0A9P4VT65_9PEZI|nr:hypothetical protein M501DRAFT_1014608 [Patellaria atrata CBS 101060]
MKNRPQEPKNDNPPTSTEKPTSPPSVNTSSQDTTANPPVKKLEYPDDGEMSKSCVTAEAYDYLLRLRKLETAVSELKIVKGAQYSELRKVESQVEPMRKNIEKSELRTRLVYQRMLILTNKLNERVDRMGQDFKALERIRRDNEDHKSKMRDMTELISKWIEIVEVVEQKNRESALTAVQPHEIGFYNPRKVEDDPSGITQISCGTNIETEYHDVNLFIARLEDLATAKRPIRCIQDCLRGQALMWYMSELDSLGRGDLRNSSLAHWCEVLRKRFEMKPHEAQRLFEECKYTIQDGAEKKDIMVHVNRALRFIRVFELEQKKWVSWVSKSLNDIPNWFAKGPSIFESLSSLLIYLRENEAWLHDHCDYLHNAMKLSANMKEIRPSSSDSPSLPFWEYPDPLSPRSRKSTEGETKPIIGYLKSSASRDMSAPVYPTFAPALNRRSREFGKPSPLGIRSVYNNAPTVPGACWAQTWSQLPTYSSPFAASKPTSSSLPYTPMNYTLPSPTTLQSAQTPCIDPLKYAPIPAATSTQSINSQGCTGNSWMELPKTSTANTAAANLTDPITTGPASTLLGRTSMHRFIDQAVINTQFEAELAQIDLRRRKREQEDAEREVLTRQTENAKVYKIVKRKSKGMGKTEGLEAVNFSGISLKDGEQKMPRQPERHQEEQETTCSMTFSRKENEKVNEEKQRSVDENTKKAQNVVAKVNGNKN